MLLGFAWMELFVESAQASANRLCAQMGFTPVGCFEDCNTFSLAIRNGGALLVVSEALGATGPVQRYLDGHPQGIADVAFWTEAFPGGPGALPGRLPATGQIVGPAGITHTFAPPQPGDLPPGFLPLPGAALRRELAGIDHVVLNLGTEAFEPAIHWYRQVLGLEASRYFEISTPHSALKSWVLTDSAHRVRLPLNAPLTANSQVSEFLEANGGPGVQHIALRTTNIAHTVDHLRTLGVEFLDAPATYFERLGDRVDLAGLDMETLRRLHILVDQDESEGRILQIFTRPLFAEPTLFFEFIERQGTALGFGEGNFQSLFEAIEREQQSRGTLEAERKPAFVQDAL
ncbi:VOC family protein [Gloeobacter violaceus]|uniref:4-hydroxyphenylpyruvate dioxygenase n=1 Tax=Gloeobacter violaceus (strain ATCC 29082 / PCC 7421) TaxID=251221 RepID=Q7NC88_GLOVI|nr:VOC family protein [Gloeobacter violaceus]BAC91032.1 4-hydroxyphenylpyruvate dioxygenase [Gloeobacter violaceus PCC 7421]